MGQPVHRDQARTFLVGVGTVILILIVGIVGSVVQAGGDLPGRTYTYVAAEFDTVGLLRPQQDVTQNGVRIGTVRAVEHRASGAFVRMRLEGDREVHRDATVRIGNESALGRRYVDIDPGDPATGPLGDRIISAESTRAAGDIDQVFDTFDEDTRTALAGAMSELGGGLVGRSDDLQNVTAAAPQLLDDAEAIMATLASEEAEVPDLLDSANLLAGRLIDSEAELRSLLTNLDRTLRGLNVDGTEPLRTTIRDLPATLTGVRKDLDQVNPVLGDVRSAVTTLRPGTVALGEATPDLRGVLREGVPPLEDVPEVGALAEPALDHLRRTLAEARPLLERLEPTLADADELLADFTPYTRDAGRFFAQHDLLSGNFGPDRHYFSAFAAGAGLDTVSLPDPVRRAEAYPAPGYGAWADQPGSDTKGLP